MNDKTSAHLKDIRSSSIFLTADLLDLVADNTNKFRKSTRKFANKLRADAFKGD